MNKVGMTGLYRKSNARTLSLAGILVSFVFLLGITSIGIIPLGFINLTIVHIPVIICTILLGIKMGLLLGGAFGLASTLAAFGLSFTGQSALAAALLGYSPILVIVMSVGPRLMIPVTTHYVYKMVSHCCKRGAEHKGKKAQNNRVTAIVCASVAGSLTNTVLYLSSMGLFLSMYGEWGMFAGRILQGVIAVAASCEAIAAAMMASTIVPILSAFLNKNKPVFPEETAVINPNYDKNKDEIEMPDEQVEGVIDSGNITVLPLAESLMPYMDERTRAVHDRGMGILLHGGYDLACQIFAKIAEQTDEPNKRMKMLVYFALVFVEADKPQNSVVFLRALLNDQETAVFISEEQISVICMMLGILRTWLFDNSSLDAVQFQRAELAYEKIRRYLKIGGVLLAGQVFDGYLSIFSLHNI